MSLNACEASFSSSASRLDDHHKQIIQYFMHDGAYNQQELIDLLVALRDRYDLNIKPKDELRMFTEHMLPLINRQIEPYGISIKQVTSEEYQNDVYFVCTQNFKSQFVKMDHSYTEKEAAIFEKLLQLIISNDDK
jgi:YHS domain-containing protein